MEIIVLLKRVPATESIIMIDDDGKSIKTNNVKWVINPYDEFAAEEAIRIKEAHGGSVTVVSIGPEKTAVTMRSALAMGADRGILINDPEVDSRDGLSLARILCAAIKDIKFDLIIAGQRAVDDDNYLVGPAVAEFLNIPHVSMVIKEEISDGRIRCHRVVEGGTVVVDAPLPALFTTQRGLNEPRYVSLPGMMKAKKKPIDIKSLEDIGVDLSSIEKPSVTVTSMRLPLERGNGKMIEGESAGARAAELVKLLHEEAKVI